MTHDQQNLMTLLADESFQRWLMETATAEEGRRWQEWLHASPARVELLAEAKSLWRAAQFIVETSPEIAGEFQRLQSRLETSTPKTATVRRLTQRRTELAPETGKRFLWKHWSALAAAATLVLALLGQTEYAPWRTRDSAKQTLSTRHGERAELKLPDGSRTILNANSVLLYSASRDEAKERRVELQGEAYFEVAARAQQPFVVQTRDGEIKVLGTKFVVYEREAGTRVVVQEGRVRVQSRVDTAAALLSAGEFLLFHQQDKKLLAQSANLDFHTTWWEEEWRLTGTPFVDIVRRLEETYGVRVEVQDERMLGRKLTGALENRDLEVLLASLAKALRVEVKREGEVVKFSEAQQR